MSSLERAKTYASIFVGVGDRWRQYVPVDATVEGNTVLLEDCVLTCSAHGNGWRVERDDEAWVVLSKKGSRT